MADFGLFSINDDYLDLGGQALGGVAGYLDNRAKKDALESRAQIARLNVQALDDTRATDAESFAIDLRALRFARDYNDRQLARELGVEETRSSVEIDRIRQDLGERLLAIGVRRQTLDLALETPGLAIESLTALNPGDAERLARGEAIDGSVGLLQSLEAGRVILQDVFAIQRDMIRLNEVSQLDQIDLSQRGADLDLEQFRDRSLTASRIAGTRYDQTLREIDARLLLAEREQDRTRADLRAQAAGRNVATTSGSVRETVRYADEEAEIEQGVLRGQRGQMTAQRNEEEELTGREIDRAERSRALAGEEADVQRRFIASRADLSEAEALLGMRREDVGLRRQLSDARLQAASALRSYERELAEARFELDETVYRLEQQQFENAYTAGLAEIRLELQRRVREAEREASIREQQMAGAAADRSADNVSVTGLLNTGAGILNAAKTVSKIPTFVDDVSGFLGGLL